MTRSCTSCTTSGARISTSSERMTGMGNCARGRASDPGLEVAGVDLQVAGGGDLGPRRPGEAVVAPRQLHQESPLAGGDGVGAEGEHEPRVEGGALVADGRDGRR